MNKQFTIEDFIRIQHILSCRTEQRNVYVTKGNRGWVCAMSKPGYRNSCRYATKKAAIQCALEFING